MKQTGTYYTPNKLADELARWVVVTGNESLLEPSVGDGALVRAAKLRAATVAADGGSLRFLACDTDEIATKKVSSNLSPQDTIIQGDFLSVSTKQHDRVDAVLANPPFTRNHALEKSYREELRTKFFVKGAAGLWVPFLFHACEFLKHGGRIAFLIPASATFTDYGKEALARVCENFSYVEVKRLEEQPEWSNVADERGALLLARGYKQGSSQVPPPFTLSTRGKGDIEYESHACHAFNELVDASSTLGDVGQVAIGVVTGCNSVFLVSELERKEESISLDDVLPIVARTRHVPGLLIDQDNLLKQGIRGEKTWLLRPKDISERFSGVRRRLARVSPRRRCNTTWFQKRRPWWAVDVGPCCDAVFTYMNHTGPRLILADKGIRCTNTLHRVQFGGRVTRKQRVTAALTFVSTFGELAAERTGRQYGGGLIKFELKEARALPILLLESEVREDVLTKVDSLLQYGQTKQARDMVDEVLLSKVLGIGWRNAVELMKHQLQELRRRRYGTQRL